MRYTTITENNHILCGDFPQTITDTLLSDIVCEDNVKVKTISAGCLVIGVVKAKPHLLVVYYMDKDMVWFYDRRVNKLVDRQPKGVPEAEFTGFNEWTLKDLKAHLSNLYAKNEIETYDGQYYPPTPFSWTIDNVTDEKIKQLAKMGCFPKRIDKTTVAINKPQGDKVNKLLKENYHLWRDDIRPVYK